MNQIVEIYIQKEKNTLNYKHFFYTGILIIKTHVQIIYLIPAKKL